MRKLLKILAPVFVLLISAVTVNAYNVVDLPEEMSMAEALGIFDASTITRATVSSLVDGQYIELKPEEINDFYYAASNMQLVRTVNPTPFRDIAINLYTGDTVHSYYLNSGVQLGLYGEDNYICYKAVDDDAVYLTYLDTLYRDEPVRENGEELHRNTSIEFLKMPNDLWAQEPIKSAASRSLLPYEMTDGYDRNISREEFCILLGNFIAVNGNYADLDAYMRSKNEPYLMNNFEDCDGKDSSINILYALGIVNGKGDGIFDPDGTLTREEAAALLCRTAEQFTFIETDGSIGYSDRGDISPWAEYFVIWASDKGIMQGTDENKFEPHSYYTVQQAIATVNRLYDFLN